MVLLHSPGEPCSTSVLPHSAESLAAVRRRMVDELLSYGIDRDVLVDAEIVLGELMANAVEHGAPLTSVPAGPRAGPLFEVGWCVVGPVLRISVVDGGAGAALRPGAFDSESLRGRGLQIVDTVCERWEADLVDGTRITAQLRLTS